MVTEWCDAAMEWIAERISVVFFLLIVGIIGAVAGIIGAVAVGIYASVQSAHSPTITLKKTEWECTGTREESSVTYVQSGKVLVPITSHYDVCVEYKKR